MANPNIPAGFPQQHVPFVDGNNRIVRDWLYLLQSLFERTGGNSGAGQVGPPGPAGTAGAAGLPLFMDSPDAEETLIVPSLFSPLGFVDEQGSGGTPGFAAGVDFTAGTTTTLTLSNAYGSAANLFITFDSEWQGADQFSLSGRTLTFTSAIPVGTSKVFVKGFLQGK